MMLKRSVQCTCGASLIVEAPDEAIIGSILAIFWGNHGLPGCGPYIDQQNPVNPNNYLDNQIGSEMVSKGFMPTRDEWEKAQAEAKANRERIELLETMLSISDRQITTLTTNRDEAHKVFSQLLETIKKGRRGEFIFGFGFEVVLTASLVESTQNALSLLEEQEFKDIENQMSEKELRRLENRGDTSVFVP